MWQSMFVLQTFAAHLNYTQGRVPVLSLQSEEQSCRTALALSGAAVIIRRTVFNHHTYFYPGQAHSSSSINQTDELRGQVHCQQEEALTERQGSSYQWRTVDHCDQRKRDFLRAAVGI